MCGDEESSKVKDKVVPRVVTKLLREKKKSNKKKKLDCYCNNFCSVDFKVLFINLFKMNYSLLEK